MFCLKDVIDHPVPEITIVDIGAMIEGKPRYDGLTQNYQSKVTGFEPNADEYQRLSRSAEPSKRYLPYFIGNGEGATFHSARYPGCSSLYEPDKNLIDLFVSIGASEGGNFEILEKQHIATQRLDDVYDLPSAHYIKMDIQGAELDVLQHAVKTLGKCLVIETEVEFVPLYKNQPLFGDIQCFLREQGFLLHKLIDVAGRCFRPLQMPENPFIPMSQMLWADAVFVRDIARLERWKDRDLLISAVILHDVYASYDLVHYLLSVYDNRNRTDFKTAYLNKLKDRKDLKTLYLNQKSHP